MISKAHDNTFKRPTHKQSILCFFMLASRATHKAGGHCRGSPATQCDKVPAWGIDSGNGREGRSGERSKGEAAFLVLDYFLVEQR